MPTEAWFICIDLNRSKVHKKTICFLFRIVKKQKLKKIQKKFKKSLDKPPVMVYNTNVVARAQRFKYARVAELADAHV